MMSILYDAGELVCRQVEMSASCPITSYMMPCKQLS